MAKRDLIDFALDSHEIECPHCKKQTIHNWPGKIILFAQTKCINCEGLFLIAMNQPRLESLNLSPRQGSAVSGNLQIPSVARPD
jgi:hypothetical protein